MKITKTIEIEYNLIQEKKKMYSQRDGDYTVSIYLCPKCETDLTELINDMQYGDISTKVYINYCPTCGYNLIK